MDSSLSDIKFYMVRCVPLKRWVGKHCTKQAFMSDSCLALLIQRGEFFRHTTWWMENPINAKVWTDLSGIRTMRKQARHAYAYDRHNGPTSPPVPLRFTSYEVVQFPEMIVIPLEDI